MRKIIGKILNFIFNSGHKHPYLEEIGCTSYPENHFGGIDGYKPFASLSNCLKQRRTKRRTKVDPRDVWDLDSYFFQWLYEHLCQLLEDTNADLTWKTYEHNGKTYTEGEYIEYLKDLCKQIILFDTFKDCPNLDWEYLNGNGEGGTIKWKNSQKELEKFREQENRNIEDLRALEKEVFDVFYELLHALWW